MSVDPIRKIMLYFTSHHVFDSRCQDSNILVVYEGGS
jgi:hypothetical protein